MPSNHFVLYCPILLLPSIFPSIRVFSSELALCIRRPKYWSFSFSISPSNEYSGLISFKIDQFDLLVVQGTLKSLLQHHSSKVSILQCSAFFIVQLSHSYMNAGKTIALTIWTFVSKVMSLLSNTLSGFVMCFIPRSKHLLSISSLRSQKATKQGHGFLRLIHLPWSSMSVQTCWERNPWKERTKIGPPGKRRVWQGGASQ